MNDIVFEMIKDYLWRRWDNNIVKESLSYDVDLNLIYSTNLIVRSLFS